MKIKAYAKVNLCLKIFKGRIESKHKLDSIFCIYKKLYDTIKITKNNQPVIYYKQHGKLINIGEDLIAKTLSYLQSKYGWDINYKIVVKKRIPFGAGLGGGSSDAAAIINYLQTINKNTILDFQDIAINLGSDIPFFLTGYPIARVSSWGDKVCPIVNFKPHIQLHINNIYSSTKTVFNALANDPEYKSRVDVDKVIHAYIYKQDFINLVYNDLTKYIIQNNKELQQEFKKYDSHSFFTGAGSTIVTIKG